MSAWEGSLSLQQAASMQIGQSGPSSNAEGIVERLRLRKSFLEGHLSEVDSLRKELERINAMLAAAGESSK